MLEDILIAITVLTCLAMAGGGFIVTMVSMWREDNRKLPVQPPVEMPEWLQGLTHEQLRELLQAKQHKSQADLLVMANNMRALNVVRYEALLVEPQALPFNTGAPEVA